MKNALLLSFSLHIAAGLMWSMIVKISHVRFVPRQVYTVKLLEASELPKPKPAVKTEQPEPEPKPKEEPKEEEMAPPPEKPKPPKPKPKPEKPKPQKTMPTSEPQKTEPSEVSHTGTEESTDATTGDIALDGEDFPFAYYISAMRRKIASSWQVPGESSRERYCVVYFRILRSGSIVSPSIETSSGNLVFDQAALRAVHQANPLPALPPGYSGDDLGVHFSFAYRKE